MRVGHRVCSTCRSLATARPIVPTSAAHRASPSPLAPILRSSSSSQGLPQSEEVRAREAARARAWYLNDTPSTPSTRSTPSSSSSSSIPPDRPQPRFTTFDPNRTTSTPLSSVPDSDPITPLPSFAPDHLHPLQAFLVANELIEPGSVQFLHTPSSGVSGSDDSREAITGERGFEARWEWVGVCEVKGRGKGVVARAERSLRTWVSGVARTPRLHEEGRSIVSPSGARAVLPDTRCGFSILVPALVGIVLTPQPASGQPRPKALSSPRKASTHRTRYGLGISPRRQRRRDLHQPLHSRGPRSLGISRPMAPGTSTAAMKTTMSPRPVYLVPSISMQYAL
jgi:hypothetical protein